MVRGFEWGSEAEERVGDDVLERFAGEQAT